MSIQTRRPPQHPALGMFLQERGKNFENRAADTITRLAGSMPFIYIHIVWFTLWIALRVEDYPYGLLTMIVSLEAIFLTTFVMISQNRTDAKRQVIADHQWRIVQIEDTQNQELLDLLLRVNLDRLAASGGYEEDFRLERVVFPVGFRDGIRDQRPVRRKRHGAGPLQLDRLVDARRVQSCCLHRGHGNE